MALIRWPAALPVPQLDPYEVAPAEGISRTDMESGPARQRQESTNAPTAVTVRWRFTNGEYAVFEAWYKWKAREGGEYFVIPLLCGLGLLDHEARFKGQFKAPKRATGGGWWVNATLEVRKRPVLTESELDILLDTDLADLQAAAAALNALANAELFLLMGA